MWHGRGSTCGFPCVGKHRVNTRALRGNAVQQSGEKFAAGETRSRTALVGTLFSFAK